MSTSTSPRATPRRGMALPIALAAIVVIGALVVGVFFASAQDYRVGRNSLSPQRAMHAADVGLSSVVSTWTTARTNGTKVGQSASLTDTTIDGVTVLRRYTRVSPTVFWVTVSATEGGGAIDRRAVKRLNGVLRVETPDFRIMGAITSRNRTSISGTAVRISGTDTVPAGWDCPPGDEPGAGLVVNDSATNLSGGAGVGACGPPLWNCVSGNPAVKDSTALASDTSTYTKFGGLNYDSLAAMATKVKTVGGSYNTMNPRFLGDGSCDVGHADNWGDTSHVNGPRGCQDYYPIVHLQGASQSYTLSGTGGGQGILLVDGNLTLTGSFKWTGIVLVKGSVTITGTGGAGGTKVIGAVAAMNKNGGTNQFSGNSSIAFSRCAISQVTSRFSTVQPMRHRAWADLTF